MEQDPASVIRRLEATLVEHQRLCAETQRIIAESQSARAEMQSVINDAQQAYDQSLWVVDTIRRPRHQDHGRLQAAILAAHRSHSEHKASYAVTKVSAGQTLWQGTVEEFTLLNHPRVRACYAWNCLDAGLTKSFSILKQPPIFAPENAVQLMLATRNLPPLLA